MKTNCYYFSNLANHCLKHIYTLKMATASYPDLTAKIQFFTYLQYNHNIQSKIYTTNWVEGLNKDSRRVLKMHGAMPNEDSVLVFRGKVTREKEKLNDESTPKSDLLFS
ncbi:MAG: transposase [Proteiniphilum sp.]|nr:transposase [Proteiniphilum sp.]